MPLRPLVRLAPLLLTLILAACATPVGPGDLEKALNNLGVDTTPTDRVDPDQEALPDDYSPLGSSAGFGDVADGSDDSGQNLTDELFLVGVEIAEGTSRLSIVEKVGVQIDGDGSVNPGTTSLLHDVGETGNGWVEGNGGFSDSGAQLRDVAAADIDNDGLEEIVIVWVDTSAADRVLRIDIIDDSEDGFAESDDTLGDGDGIIDVAVVGGDFDGDGESEIVVGLTFADSAELRFLTRSGSSWSFDNALTKSYAADFSDSSTLTMELASGNMDYDSPEELALLINEFFGGSGGPDGTSRYFVYDDGDAGFTELDSGNVQGQDGSTIVAKIADLDLGDVDGDGLAELVMGGIAEINTGCGTYDGFVTVLDDAKNDLAPLDTDTFNAFFDKCPAFAPWRLRFVHIGAFDLDGDGIDEIHANLRVYEDLNDTSDLTLIHELPQDVWLDTDADGSARISSATTLLSTGDVTGDGRENLIVWAQWQGDIRIWGLSAITQVGFAELSTLAVTSFANTQTGVGPIALPVNLDMDSPILKYDEGVYELVFTEPLVVATLAAAPCAEGIGQNLGACSTTFGQGDSTTVDASLTVTVSASAHVGVKTGLNIPLVGGGEAEFKKTVTLTASLSAGIAYTVEKSRTFTTGPLEDGVVFTTIPYDRYVYTITSHPDPDLVGGTVIVSLPREPIILKVERDFFNANVVDSDIQIDSDIFDHTPGDLSSYPSSSRKNQLLGQYGGLENGPISVGQGSGSSGLAIDVQTEVSAGGSLGISYEKSVEVTGQVAGQEAMAGFSVGYGAEASLTITSGNQTSYSAEVGDLDAANFAANQYSYGIFTYVQELGEQEFEVINFWVD
jgi:hypothetical protein